MSEITISQALGWKKTLSQRHSELVELRNENSKKQTRYMTETEKVNSEPVYDVKKLDKLVSNVAREIRKLDEAIKTANAVTIVKDYDKNDGILGEVE